MALEKQWQRIKALTTEMQQKVTSEPDRVSELWHERQQLLEELLSESRMATLSTEDLNWLRDAVEELQQEEQRFLDSLGSAQKEIMGLLRKQQGDARAIKAYQNQRDG